MLAVASLNPNVPLKYSVTVDTHGTVNKSCSAVDAKYGDETLPLPEKMSGCIGGVGLAAPIADSGTALYANSCVTAELISGGALHDLKPLLLKPT